MTAFQKAIKYFAIAFAMLLIVSIAGGILSVFTGLSYLANDEKETYEPQTFQVSEGIESIDIDIDSAVVHFVDSDDFTVDTKNKGIEVYENNGTLYIKEKNKGFWFFNESDIDKDEVDISINRPAEKVFKSANFSAGAGIISGGMLFSNELLVDIGAGYFGFAHVDVDTKATINGGAGEISLGNGTIHDLELDMGVGKLLLIAELTGDSDIDLGVGKSVIALDGEEKDYSLDISKGIGSVTVDGDEVSGDYRSGNGQNKLAIDGGIGSISIDFLSNGENK